MHLPSLLLCKSRHLQRMLSTKLVCHLPKFKGNEMTNWKSAKIREVRSKEKPVLIGSDVPVMKRYQTVIFESQSTFDLKPHADLF